MKLIIALLIFGSGFIGGIGTWLILERTRQVTPMCLVTEEIYDMVKK